MIPYQDKQANGATIVNTDLIETANDNQSFYNVANQGRFRILYDHQINLNPLAAAGDGAVNDTPQLVRGGMFSKALNIPLEFSAGAGAITELRSNNIGVLLITQNGLAGFISNMRLRFSDA